MNYEQLKTLCVALYGRTWKPNLAHDLNIKRTTIDNWSSQGVPKWLDDEIYKIINKRKESIEKGIKEFLNVKRI